MPLLTALTAFVAWRSLRRGGDTVPFVATIGLFLLGFLGLVISSFPYLVPPSLTIWQTAAAPASQIFMLVGTLVLLPLILAYTALRLLAVPRQGRTGRKLSLRRVHVLHWPGPRTPPPRRWRCRLRRAKLRLLGLLHGSGCFASVCCG